MKTYRVTVKLEKTKIVRDVFYVAAFDERGARQEALESAEAAYPEYDSAHVMQISTGEVDE